MAFQLIFNSIPLTVNGEDGAVVQYNDDGTIRRSWESLFEAMRDLPTMERGYDEFIWRGK